jgi:UDP-GlcNAc:undecaprenyl-phosphate GlcNAc-1-phosphate transferase
VTEITLRRLRVSVALAIAAIVGVSLLVALVCTPVARALAVRMGAVTHPSSDRWQKRPTPLLGGVAIVVATAAGLATATLFVGDGWAVWPGAVAAGPALGLAASAVIMLIVGLVDDLVGLRPPAKFLLQVLAGVTLLSFGGVLPVTPWYVANVVATLFWFVALTNAFNLLDGLDGVAAGVGAIASFFLGLTFAREGAWVHASVAWSLTGATIGFLRYNFHPASIFMGDAGSLFLGAALAGLVVTAPSRASTSLVSVLFVPLAIVAVPLLDTTLVTVTRMLSGRSILQGGLDHSTYRLIALGLTESQVALLLYAFALVGGVVAIVLTWLDHGLGLLLGATFLVAMSLLAAYLGRIQSGPAEQVRRMTPETLLVRNLFYKRRLAEILLDVVLITLAYYGAYRLKFDGVLPPDYATAFEATVALVIALNVGAFAVFGVYRGAWEYAGIFDVHRVVGAILVSGAVLFAYAEWRVPALAQLRSIVYIDTVLAMALVLASRLSFKSLELIRERLGRHGARVLIYGADDGGELTLRELRNHGDLGLRPVCFVDDDARRHGAEIHGVPIVAGFDGLAWAVHRYKIDKIVIGTRKLPPEAVGVIGALARQLGLEVAEVSFQVHWIAAAGAVEAATALEASLAGGGNGHGEPGRAVVEPNAAAAAEGEPQVTLTDLRAAG